MATSAEHVLLDTSAAIARVSSGNPFHAAVKRRVGDAVCGLSGHAYFETLSVLTRLPPPQRLSGPRALQLIARQFPESRFLDAEQQAGAGVMLVAGRVIGGAVYDGLVGLAAKVNGLTLVSCDHRAATTYRALGVRVELMDPS